MTIQIGFASARAELDRVPGIGITAGVEGFLRLKWKVNRNERQRT
jgi:hypothetical protein